MWLCFDFRTRNLLYRKGKGETQNMVRSLQDRHDLTHVPFERAASISKFTAWPKWKHALHIIKPWQIGKNPVLLQRSHALYSPLDDTEGFFAPVEKYGWLELGCSYVLKSSRTLPSRLCIAAQALLSHWPESARVGCTTPERECRYVWYGEKRLTLNCGTWSWTTVLNLSGRIDLFWSEHCLKLCSSVPYLQDFEQCYLSQSFL